MKIYLVFGLVSLALLGCGGEAMVKSKYEARVHADEKKRVGLMTNERHQEEVKRIAASKLPEKPVATVDKKAIGERYSASVKGSDSAAATRAYNSGRISKAEYNQYLSKVRREKYALMAAAIGAGLSASSPTSGGFASGVQSGMRNTASLYSGSSQPASGYKYDPSTGNSYTYNTDSLGNTYVRGSNATNGTNWSSTIDKQGNQRGFDSKMNSWTYDVATGNYYNYGTGKSCFGKGYFRQCY